jgi:hypothetical protein
MVFGIGFGITPIGEQADNLEAIRRTAAYQDCPRHGSFFSFLRWVRGIKGRYAPRWLLDAAYSGDGKARRHSNRHHQPGCMVPAGKRRAR